VTEPDVTKNHPPSRLVPGVPRPAAALGRRGECRKTQLPGGPPPNPSRGRFPLARRKTGSRPGPCHGPSPPSRPPAARPGPQRRWPFAEVSPSSGRFGRSPAEVLPRFPPPGHCQEGQIVGETVRFQNQPRHKMAGGGRHQSFTHPPLPAVLMLVRAPRARISMKRGPPAPGGHPRRSADSGPGPPARLRPGRNKAGPPRPVSAKQTGGSPVDLPTPLPPRGPGFEHRRQPHPGLPWDLLRPSAAVGPAPRSPDGAGRPPQPADGCPCGPPLRGIQTATQTDPHALGHPPPALPVSNAPGHGEPPEKPLPGQTVRTKINAGQPPPLQLCAGGRRAAVSS